MLLDVCLVYEQRGRSILLALDLTALLGHRPGDLRRCRGADRELHKPLHTYVLLC